MIKQTKIFIVKSLSKDWNEFKVEVVACSMREAMDVHDEYFKREYPDKQVPEITDVKAYGGSFVILKTD